MTVGKRARACAIHHLLLTAVRSKIKCQESTTSSGRIAGPAILTSRGKHVEMEPDEERQQAECTDQQAKSLRLQ